MRVTHLWVGLAAVAGVGLYTPGEARGWGKEGHEVVARVANRHLTGRARTALTDLLATAQFKSLDDGRLANWPDAIRGSTFYRNKYKNMDRWHFIDIDITKPAPARDDLAALCPGDEDCAPARIARFRSILGNPSLPTRDRQEALFFVVHLVGDIHQPLHCAERGGDRGGNLCRVRLPGDSHVFALHHVWDTNLVQEAVGPLSLADYADRLAGVSSADRAAAQKGTVEDWVVESHGVARAGVYNGVPLQSSPVDLDDDYVLNGALVAEAQLTKGGLRLAKVLNETLRD